LPTRLTTRDLVLAALFAALTSVSAWIWAPVFGEVPFTLQVLFVLVAGLVLGARLGALSMLVYLTLGLFAPVYAGGTSGLGVLFGPTGGYLWGFVLAAALVGALAARLGRRSPLILCATALAGLVPIYALGTMWLTWQIDISLWAAVKVGVLPFVLLDAVKAGVAGFTAYALAGSPLGLLAPVQED
jgi:biotin transport system substrate-specific component